MLELQARERLRQQEDALLFPGGSPHGSPREGYTAPQARIGPSALYERLKKQLPGVLGTSALSALNDRACVCCTSCHRRTCQVHRRMPLSPAMGS